MKTPGNRVRSVRKRKLGSGRSKSKGRSPPQRHTRKRCLPQRKRVFLDQGAFLNLVLAATEAYRSETYGILLGTHKRGITYVHGATPYQTAVRKPTSVYLKSHRRKVLKHILQAISRPHYLGEFHSHVGYGDKPAGAALSPDDLIGTADQDIQVLVAVRLRRATMPWKHNQDGSLSGTVGRYFLKMRAFQMHVTRLGSTLARVTSLRCQYALKNGNRKAASLPRRG